MPHALAGSRVIFGQYFSVGNAEIYGLCWTEPAWRGDKHSFNEGAFVAGRAFAEGFYTFDDIAFDVDIGVHHFWNEDPAETTLKKIDLDRIYLIRDFPAEMAAKFKLNPPSGASSILVVPVPTKIDVIGAR